MCDRDEMIVISKELFVLGSSGDTAASNDVEISKKEAEISELEEEQKKLDKIQSEMKAWMTMSGSSRSHPTAISRPTLQEIEEADSRSVYVGNVDYSVTETELEAHFKECGSARRVTIQYDKFSGRPKGFAYIEFNDKESVKNALELTDSLLKGRQIKVSEKRTNKPGISTSNRIPRGRGGFHGRDRGGVVVKYIYPNGFPPRGRGLRRGVYSKNNIAQSTSTFLQ